MLDNINPKIWGETFWKTGFIVAYSFPTNPSFDDKELVRNFFNNYASILPCEKCRLNFQKHLEKFPLTTNVLTNKFNLLVWFLNIHNEVNKMLNKPQLTLDDVYEKFLVGTTNNKKKIVTLVLIFFIITIIITYLVINKTANN